MSNHSLSHEPMPRLHGGFSYLLLLLLGMLFDVRRITQLSWITVSSGSREMSGSEVKCSRRYAASSSCSNWNWRSVSASGISSDNVAIVNSLQKRIATDSRFPVVPQRGKGGKSSVKLIHSAWREYKLQDTRGSGRIDVSSGFLAPVTFPFAFLHQPF